MEHFRKGIELNVNVCELRRKILGEDHAETKKAYENIEFMYKYFDWNPANAEAYEAIFEARSRLQGETHIDTLRALARIIRFYDKPEDEAKREAYLIRARKLKKEVLNQNRRDRIKASVEKAITHLRRSR